MMDIEKIIAIERNFGASVKVKGYRRVIFS